MSTTIQRYIFLKMASDNASVDNVETNRDIEKLVAVVWDASYPLNIGEGTWNCLADAFFSQKYKNSVYAVAFRSLSKLEDKYIFAESINHIPASVGDKIVTIPIGEEWFSLKNSILLNLLGVFFKQYPLLRDILDSADVDSLKVLDKQQFTIVNNYGSFLVYFKEHIVSDS